MGGATPASDSLYPCEYFLQTPLDPTSCHDWVVPRVMLLNLLNLQKCKTCMVGFGVLVGFWFFVGH